MRKDAGYAKTKKKMQKEESDGRKASRACWDRQHHLQIQVPQNVTHMYTSVNAQWKPGGL